MRRRTPIGKNEHLRHFGIELQRIETVVDISHGDVHRSAELPRGVRLHVGRTVEKLSRIYDEAFAARVENIGVAEIAARCRHARSPPFELVVNAEREIGPRLNCDVGLRHGKKHFLGFGFRLAGRFDGVDWRLAG